MLFSASLKLNMKRQRLDSSSLIHQENAKSEKASFVLSLLIAKQKEPYTIGDEFILPCIKSMAEHVLDKESAEKMASLSLSSDKVQRQISLMSDDIKEQVIQQLKEAGLFSIQLDESTEIQCCSQLVAFVRYVHSGDIKEDFLFCETLEESTKSDDVLQKLSEFFEANGLDWGNLCSICTDGASALLGSESGFVSRVLQKSPNAIPLHCMIHRQGLTTQTLPSELQKTLNTIIKTVEFLKETAHETRLVKDLCQDINATHEILLLYTEVHWLFEGNILQRIFELKQEIRVFLEAQDQQDLLSAWCADGFEIQLAYLVDIFQHIITLNLELQGKGTLIIDFVDKIKVFIRRMKNWRQEVEIGNLAMFETMSDITQQCDTAVKNFIVQHLQALVEELERYIPDIESQTSLIVKFPFTAPETCMHDDGQTELLALQKDTAAKMKFETESLTVFWSSMAVSYPKLINLALRHLLPFASTHSCEAAFSKILYIESHFFDRRDVQHDLRCTLSETKPRIDMLVDRLLHQPSA